MKTSFALALAPLAWLFLGTALLGASGCAMEYRLVTVPQIVSMSQAGVPAGEIIDEIRRSRTVYRLKQSQVEELQARGVSNEVIDFMQRTYVVALKRRNKELMEKDLSGYGFWTQNRGDYWYSFGWPSWDTEPTDVYVRVPPEALQGPQWPREETRVRPEGVDEDVWNDLTEELEEERSLLRDVPE